MPAPQVTHERQRISIRKRQIQQQDVRPAGRDEVHGVPSRRRLTDDLEPLIAGKHETQAFAHEVMVVNQTYPDRSRGRC
jgi:hypothetical protein